jgi:hypothetical protein
LRFELQKKLLPEFKNYDRLLFPSVFILLQTQNPALNCVQNSMFLGIFAIYCENRKAGCGLAEEIYNKIN